MTTLADYALAPGEVAEPVRMAVYTIMRRWRPGSYPPPWSWRDEETDFFTRQPEYMDAMAVALLRRGWSAFLDDGSILLGNDGRVWNGHHRIVLARRLGITHLTVEVYPDEASGSST